MPEDNQLQQTVRSYTPLHAGSYEWHGSYPMTVSDRYSYPSEGDSNFIRPPWSTTVPTTPDYSKYTDDQLANMVIRGELDNGARRRELLGDRYSSIQQRVNALMAPATPATPATPTTPATPVTPATPTTPATPITPATTPSYGGNYSLPYTTYQDYNTRVNGTSMLPAQNPMQQSLWASSNLGQMPQQSTPLTQNTGVTSGSTPVSTSETTQEPLYYSRRNWIQRLGDRWQNRRDFNNTMREVRNLQVEAQATKKANGDMSQYQPRIAELNEKLRKISNTYENIK